MRMAELGSGTGTGWEYSCVSPCVRHCVYTCVRPHVQHCVRAKGERLGEELRLIISQNKLMMYCASYRVRGGVGGGRWIMAIIAY